MQSSEMGHICVKYDSQSGLHRAMSSRILVSLGYQSPCSTLKQKGIILLAFPG